MRHAKSTFYPAGLVALLVGRLLTGCSKSPPAPATAEAERSETKTAEPWFEEVAARANLNFRHTSGHTRRFYNPEIICGGVALFDYDGDGRLDVYCVQGGSLDPAVTNQATKKLYRNLGNWKFQDVTDAARVGDTGYGMGCACADYDGDGHVDLFVTNVGRNVLYRNNGDGTFTDVTRKAGLETQGWGTSCAFFDYDGDGQLDLIVANYMNWSPEREVDCYSRGGLPDYCSPMSYRAPARDKLYHNKGDGTFEDVTISAGLAQAFGNGLGVVCADFNGDGRPDILIANDAMPNQLWINQGRGKFTDEAMLRGCAVNSLGIAEAGMGVVAVDIFQRGALDVFITHLVGEGNRLFVNSNGFFIDLVKPKGPGAPSLPFTGFGTGFADFDNDGQLDLYVVNGRVKYGQVPLDPRDPYAEPNNLLRGLGNGEFEEINNGGTTRRLIAASRGAAFGDLDNDGAIDIVVINRDGPLHVLRNLVGRRGHWIMLRVLNRKGTDALGAIVRLAAGGRSLWRQVQPNQGYCSSNDPRVHFGLGKERRVDRVSIRWESGAEEIFGPFESDRIYELREGGGSRSAKPN